MNILVVDDDVRLLEEVRGILTHHGHSVDCADSADKAVPMVRSTRYDFVLVDYRMPEHDGMWFMKNAGLPRETKALLATSYIDREAIRGMFAAGVRGYIVKPFDEEELLKHLEFHSSRQGADDAERKEDAI